MRILALLLICAELLLILNLAVGPMMTSHKPLAAAVNRYRTSPSQETEAEMNKLRQIAQAQDRRERLRSLGLLAANSCALFLTLLAIRKHKTNRRPAPECARPTPIASMK